LGYLDDESLSQILADVTVFAYPSLYEGFGIPVLDAMRAGIPVLTSRNGSLAEVAGDACLCVDPLSVSDIAKGLEKLLCDDVTRERLKAAGMDRARHFTWKLVVDRFLETMRRFEGEE
jgi:glycosyltransferase involved in cell wall biosynthesis